MDQTEATPIAAQTGPAVTKTLSGRPPRSSAYTLIELLVIIAIITILIVILLPGLGKAREVAQGAKSMSNLHQIGVANQAYLNDFKDYFMPHESKYFFTDNRFHPATDTSVPANQRAGAHWEDHLVAYVAIPEVFLSPLLTDKELNSGFMNYFAVPPFQDPAKGGTNPKKRGGYGYNNHYLGYEAGPNGFNARIGLDITAPSSTVLVGDTAGSRNNSAGSDPTNSYVVEPPLPSLTFGAKLNKYYKGSSAGDVETPNPGPYDWIRRAYPAPRNAGVPEFLFTDGHSAKKTIDAIDDLNQDGVRDNGYWNGRADPSVR